MSVIIVWLDSVVLSTHGVVKVKGFSTSKYFDQCPVLVKVTMVAINLLPCTLLLLSSFTCENMLDAGKLYPPSHTIGSLC